MKHTLHITGVKVDLAQPVDEVIATINASLERFYPDGLVKVESYSELDERTCEIKLARNLPFNYSYGLGGDCLCYIDESIISGVAEKYFTLDFTGKTSPVVAPLIPWGNAWYAPKQAFNSFFRHLNETLCSEKISRVKVMSSTTDLTITVKYPREKGKYDDDIKDLETELGGTLDGHRGETLSYTLKQLGEICERTYIKVKSYMGLKTYLKKTYDIDLEIN